jgi:hypothetical protein
MTVMYGGMRVKAKMYNPKGSIEMRSREVNDREEPRVEVELASIVE